MFFRLLILLLVSSVQLWASTEIKWPTINYLGADTQLENSLFIDGDTQYFSLFDIAKLQELRFSKSPKNNGYIFYNDANHYLFVKQSRELWINHSKQFMSKPIRVMQGKPYIDTAQLEFIFSLKPTYNAENKRLTLAKSTRFKESDDSPYNSFKRIRAGSTTLPFKRLPNKVFLAHHNLHVPIKDALFEDNGLFYIKGEQLLKELGFEFNTTSDSVRISQHNFDYNIPLNSRFWSCEHENKTWQFMAASPVKTVHGDLYFELESLFSFLDFSFYWNHFTSSIELLTNIHDFSFIEENDTYKIAITSRYPLKNSYDNVHEHNQSYSTVIPYAKSFGKYKDKWKNHKVIESIVLKNYNYTYEQLQEDASRYQNKANVQIVYRLTNLEYAAYFKSPENRASTKGLVVHLDSRLKGISVKENNDSYKVSFKLSRSVKANVLKEGKKIILDFPNTVNELPQVKPFQSADLVSMRTSQYSTSPLVSRVVLDFATEAPSYSVEEDNGSFAVILQKSKVSATAPASTSTSTATKAKSAAKKSYTAVKARKKSSSKKKSSKRGSLKNKVVIIDAGHGGNDPGAVVKRRTYEKTYTLDIAKRLAAKFKAEGAHVVMTRSNDSNPSLHRRIRIANKNKADIFISVHLNSFTSSKARGSETYYYKSKDRKLAQYIQKQLKKDLPTKSNGIKRNRFFVLRHTRMPSILIEPLFITNKKELALLKQDSFRDKIASSIFIGVRSYFKYNS